MPLLVLLRPFGTSVRVFHCCNDKVDIRVNTNVYEICLVDFYITGDLVFCFSSHLCHVMVTS